MADTPKHSVSVAGIVVDEQDRVLVIQRRDNGHWEPPGGVLELDETPEAGVEREVLEETGVRVEAVQLTGVYKNMTLGIVALVFSCRQTSGTPHPTEESKSVKWAAVDEVTRHMTPAFSVRITDAVGASVVASRSHDGINLLAAP